MVTGTLCCNNFWGFLEGWKMVLILMRFCTSMRLSRWLLISIFFFQTLFATASRIQDGIGTSGDKKSS